MQTANFESAWAVLKYYSRYKMWYPSIFKNNWLKLPGIYLCLILIITGQETCAQGTPDPDPQKWTLSAGVLFSKHRVVDKTFSSIPYSGNNWGGYLSVKLRKKRSLHEIRGFYAKGVLQAASPSTDELSQTYMNADYAWLYKLGGDDGHSLFAFKAGAGIDVLYTKREYTRFINNNESFEFAASLSGIFEASYFFNNKSQGFSISNRVCLPFLSFITQPIFGGEDSQDSDKNSEVTAFSLFFRFINSLSLEKKLSDRQKLSLFYTWDYYQIRRAREVKQAAHQLGLTYSFII